MQCWHWLSCLAFCLYTFSVVRGELSNLDTDSALPDANPEYSGKSQNEFEPSAPRTATTVDAENQASAMPGTTRQNEVKSPGESLKAQSQPPSGDFPSADIAEAKSREPCAQVVHQYTTSIAHESGSGRNWLDSFQALWSTSVVDLTKDSDKDALAAIKSLITALQFSGNVDFQTMGALVTCDVDGTGKTILMKLIERGFLRCIEHDATWTVFSPKKYNELVHAVDKDGNNILHLAVRSRSTSIVSSIIHRLARNLESVADVRPFFDSVNKDGRHPVDLARDPGMPAEIWTSLQEFYRTHFFGTGAADQRPLFLGPPQRVEQPIKHHG